MATVRYRNRQTGHVAAFASPNRRLEQDDRWEHVTDRPDDDDLEAVWAAHATSVGVDVDGRTKAEIIDADDSHDGG